MNWGARQRAFLEIEDDQRFLQTLAEAHDLWGVHVFGYCLMGNHYHVCLRTPEGYLARKTGLRSAVIAVGGASSIHAPRAA